MMNKQVGYLLAGVVFSLIFLGCDDDSEDRLKAENILGEYTLASRSVDNISDLSVPCCDTLELTTDADPDDLRGAVRASGVGYENSGAFTLNPSEGLIEFEYESTQRLRAYEQIDEQLFLTYEEENQTIREGWQRMPQ
jgi:hypothetical protein